MTQPPTSSSQSATDDRVWAEELAMALVDAAKKAGADACDATVGLSSSIQASARDGAIEDLEKSASRAAAVRVIVEGRLGFATSSDAPLTPRDVGDLAATAVALARLAGPADHNVILPPGGLSPAEIRAAGDALQTFDDVTAAAGPDWAAAQALLMEHVVRGHEGVVGVRSVSAGARRGIFALASSTGFVGSTRGTSCSLSCSAVVEDGARKQIEGWWSAARALHLLEDPASVADEAARRALARRGARKVPTTRAAVVFDAPTARGFLSAIVSGMSGEAIARRQSFLLGKKDDVVFVPGFPLVDDPSLPRGLASRPFDGEGQVGRRTILIDEHGRLVTWLHDGRSATRLGEPPTGHAARGATSLPMPSPTNTTLGGGRGDLASVVKETPRGLLVTRMLGHGPDMTTGDYSRGAAGYWIEDGAIAFPVEEVTIAGHMLDMMKGIDRVGADLDLRSSLRVPCLRFAELSIGGK